MNFKPFLLITMVFGISCSPGKAGEDYQKAFEAHEELLATEAETRSIFDSMEQILARDTTLAVFSEELKTLSAKLEAWENRVVAVGEEADHRDHHHPHSHRGSQSLTDTELSQLQEKLKTELDEITSEVSALVEKMMDR
jgi:predicted RNase H-like nuclease (RuvC/YqgF family)